MTREESKAQYGFDVHEGVERTRMTPAAPHRNMSLSRKAVVNGLLLTGAIIGCPQWDIHTKQGDVYRSGHDWLWSPPGPAKAYREQTPKVNLEVLALQVACMLVLTVAIELAVKNRKR